VQWISQLNTARVVRGDKVSLEDVTLSILPGAKIGGVGPNGSGKSTLLRWFLDRLATHILAWERTETTPAQWFWLEGETSLATRRTKSADSTPKWPAFIEQRTASSSEADRRP
jgi:ABC-type hemin transport system ATPase subunit